MSFNFTGYAQASTTNLIPDDGMKPVGSMTEEEIRREKLSIWKNVFVISLSFMCLFTAYNSGKRLKSI